MAEIWRTLKGRVQSSLFGQGPVKTTRAVADGYYVMLEPLSPGRHTFQFSANAVDNPTIGTYSYAIFTSSTI